ncbi:hypothetical protein AU476_18030 [Cupriavidus sp. UYMSc13B]|nr:hypothetical protein AU476_18030 [Cupriavidus sp. UYMSc13B]
MRREYERGSYGAVAQASAEFVPICFEPLVHHPSPVASSPDATTTVELHLPKGRIVMHDVDMAYLCALIEALR